MTIARQRLGNHCRSYAHALKIEENTLLGNWQINTHSGATEEKCFPGVSRLAAVGLQKSTRSTTENENEASPRQSRVRLKICCELL
jgi:hypothetical protein